MQVKKTQLTDTSVSLTVIPSAEELGAIELDVLKAMNHQVKVPGFRPGNAPPAMVAKFADQAKLQNEFLDNAISQLYITAVESEKLRPVEQPQVSIKKFVPFSQLEFDAVIEVVGEIKLANYKNLKISRQKATVTTIEVDEVVESLRLRSAEKKEVSRAAKDKDEVVIDFSGVDPETLKPVAGADSKDYPLILGSQSFIPGFEAKLIGLKTGDEKSFDITFPKDYAVSALQGKKVQFSVTVKKVYELKPPALNEAFVKKVSPFKTLDELKADIKKQLLTEQQTKDDRAFENDIINKITEGSTVAIPKALVEQQLERAENSERQNLAYQGKTWEEHLAEEGVTEEQHRERNRPGAEQSVKASLILSEIAELENIEVTKEEAEVRLQVLKGQYQDAKMQAELDKPENRQSLINQILTEKTFEKLVSYVKKS